MRLYNLLQGDVTYREPGIYDVKGSVRVLFKKLHHRGERGEKGESANVKLKHKEPLLS